jgi:hypothetical protein
MDLWESHSHMWELPSVLRSLSITQPDKMWLCVHEVLRNLCWNVLWLLAERPGAFLFISTTQRLATIRLKNKIPQYLNWEWMWCKHLTPPLWCTFFFSWNDRFPRPFLEFDRNLPSYSRFCGLIFFSILKWKLLQRHHDIIPGQWVSFAVTRHATRSEVKGSFE